MAMVKNPVVGQKYWMVDGRLFETQAQAKACALRIAANDRLIHHVRCEESEKYRTAFTTIAKYGWEYRDGKWTIFAI